jgi:hypothetical protein
LEISHSEIISALYKLEKMLDQACMNEESTNESKRHLENAIKLIQNSDILGTIDQTDLFVLSIVRKIGPEISLLRAFELLDVAWMDVKQPVADPAQMYAEAKEVVRLIARKSQSVEISDKLVIHLISSRAPTEQGRLKTLSVIKQQLATFHLPSSIEQELLKKAEAIASIKSSADPVSTVAAMEGFTAALESLSGSYISETEANRLAGLSLFGSPGEPRSALVVNALWGWIIGIGIAIILLIFIGKAILDLISSSEVRTVLMGLLEFIDKCYHSNEQVRAETNRQASNAGLNDDQKRELRKGLEGARDGERFGGNVRKQEKCNAALQDLPQ